MNEVSNTKPEPLSPKANWHYDSYFLLQLQHRHNRAAISPHAEQVAQELFKINPTGKTAAAKIDQPVARVILDRNEIIKQINDLADSIGVSVRIIEATSA
ncbi:MAG: hypothetical protein M0R33_22995 [Methylomonas sp.]|jgi:hypothetical protein|uniref:hypothetical protein n=1 Tax=Methylomonas sp. TaxID=418 RepID=UPI0025CDF368|nr:hypothetical protein [Methylomonas sp.]MCK9609311.1 hypothetical protein [Methylomonas sp.]